MDTPLRSQSALQTRTSSRFQLRASQLLKTVTGLRGRANSWKIWKNKPPPVYRHEAATSLDGQPKPYLSQPALRLEQIASDGVAVAAAITGGDGGQGGGDTDSSSLSESPLGSPSKRHSRRMSWDRMPANTTISNLIPLIRADTMPALDINDRPSQASPVVIVPPFQNDNDDHGFGRATTKTPTTTTTMTPTTTQSNSPNENRLEAPLPRLTQRSLKPRPSTTRAISDLPPAASSPATPASTSTPTPTAPPSDTTRPQALRLSSLPTGLPTSWAHSPSTSCARLPPSVAYRQPPMPLNLPPLPTAPPMSSASSSATGRNSDRATMSRMPSRRRLRAMPALPREGSHPAADDEGGQDEDFADDDDDVETGIPPLAPSDDEEDSGYEEEEDARAAASSSQTSHFDNGDGATTLFWQRDGILPRVAISPMDTSFLGLSTASGSWIGHRSVSSEKTPTAASAAGAFSAPADYFNPRPLPVGRQSSSSTIMPRLSASRRASEMLTPKWSPSVGMYRHTSKSMVDIATTSMMEDTRELHAPAATIHEETQWSLGKGKGKAREGSPSLTATAGSPEHELPTQSASSGASSSTPTQASTHAHPLLRRQSSMPTFHSSTSPPPPYPLFSWHHNHLGSYAPPHEEEGHEKLPQYTNDIYLKAIMPRKMEFSAPGVQAKDRKWRRMLCVLEGTMFSVYKCPSGVAGVGIIGEWWEKRVGVGDASLQPQTATAAPPASPSSAVSKVPPQKLEADGDTVRAHRPRSLSMSMPAAVRQVSVTPSPSPSRSQTPIPTPATPPPSNRSMLNLALTLRKSATTLRSHSRTRSDASRGAAAGNSSAVSSSQNRQRRAATPTPPPPPLPPGVASSGVTRHSPTPTRPARFTAPLSAPAGGETTEMPGPNAADLLRRYTLQHAESGLGNDYVKRKNVIRVRMEGEQFLLQARDIGAVIEWIEGFQASTNIALDLDERPMPRPPMFPRRRRRRNRRQEESNEAQSLGRASAQVVVGEET